MPHYKYFERSLPLALSILSLLKRSHILRGMKISRRKSFLNYHPRGYLLWQRLDGNEQNHDGNEWKMNGNVAIS